MRTINRVSRGRGQGQEGDNVERGQRLSQGQWASKRSAERSSSLCVSKEESMKKDDVLPLDAWRDHEK